MHLIKAFFLYLALVSAANAYNFKASPPALWESTSTLAISGKRFETIGILVQNVCSKITELWNNRAPNNFTVANCSELQSVLFKEPIKTFCSKISSSQTTNQFNRIRRFFALLLGSYQRPAVFHSPNQTQLGEFVQTGLTSKILSNQDDLIKSGFHGTDLHLFEAGQLKEDFKTMLITMEHLIKNRTDYFDDKEANFKFLQKLGVDFRYVAENLIAENSSLVSCEWHEPSSTIVASLELALGHPNQSVYKLVPFRMFEQDRQSRWCEYRLNSFEFGLVNKSNRENCFSSQKQISYLDCRGPPATPNFKLFACSEQKPAVQVRRLNGKPHVYCPGHQISINGKPFEECPNFVFELKTYDNFSFNESFGKHEAWDHSDEEINAVLNQELFGSNPEDWINWKNRPDWLRWIREQLFKWYGLVGVGLALLVLICISIRCCRRCRHRSDQESEYGDPEEEEELKTSPGNLKYRSNVFD